MESEQAGLVILIGLIRTPITITGIHPLAQFLLPGVLVVVFLDGPGIVARHFGDVG